MKQRKWPAYDGWYIEAAGVLVCLLTTAAVYAVGFAPVLEREAERMAQRQRLSELRAESKEASITLSKLRQQLAKTRRAAERSKIHLQPVNQLNRHLARVTDLADACGLQVNEIQPGETVHSDRYEKVPIHLGGTGAYPACAKFLHRLHRTFADTGVASFELTGKPMQPNRPSRFRITLTWFASPMLPAEARAGGS